MTVTFNQCPPSSQRGWAADFTFYFWNQMSPCREIASDTHPCCTTAVSELHPLLTPMVFTAVCSLLHPRRSSWIICSSEESQPLLNPTDSNGVEPVSFNFIDNAPYLNAISTLRFLQGDKTLWLVFRNFPHSGRKVPLAWKRLRTPRFSYIFQGAGCASGFSWSL